MADKWQQCDRIVKGFQQFLSSEVSEIKLHTDLTLCPMPMINSPFFLMLLTNSMGIVPE